MAGNPEQEVYESVVELRKAVDTILGVTLELPATIELCVFAGKLSAARDVLVSLEQAGAPIHDEYESSHYLDERVSKES